MNRSLKLARLFVLVGGLIVLVLTAALVGPYFVDWTSYRADFEREASRVLGRTVTVDGAASARLLPFPSVTFSNVRVADAGPDGPAMTVDQFSMDAELAPFLRGEVLIFDMRLVRPRVTIAVAGDGHIDWAARPDAVFDPRQVRLEKVTVTDGEVTIHHGSGGRTYVLSGIDADISAKSLAGPWRLDGRVTADGEPLTLSLSTGTVDETGRMRLRLRANPDRYPVAVEMDGDARLDEGIATYRGQFRLAERVAEEDGKEGAPAASAARKVPGYRIAGTFGFDHKRLAVDEFRFETGPREDPYTADGTAFLDIGEAPHFRITATGAQVRLDAPEGGEGPDRASLTLEQRIAALKRVVLALPEPGVPGRIDLKLPAIVAGDTTIRDVALSAEPAAGGWTVQTLNATLPGRTTLEASGQLRTADGFGFSGSLLLAVAQPSGFAAWISRDVDEAIRRLPAAGFLAAVDLTERRQTFRNLELILGDARFRGSIDSRQPANANPSMVLKLAGGRLDVEGLAAFASLFVDREGQARLADHDLDVEVKAGPVVAAGLSAQSVDAALRLSGGQLDIDRLSVAGLAGATIAATGTLRDLGAVPTGTLDLSVVSADLEPLLALLAERYPGNALVGGLAARARNFPGLLEDAEVSLVANSAAAGDGANDVSVSAHGKAGGNSFTLSGSGSGRADALGKAQLSLDATLSSLDAASAYALYGLPALPLGVAGAVDTSLSARGSLTAGLATSIRVSGPDLTASFDGSVKEAGGAPAVAGQALVNTGDIGPWLMTAGVALPGMELGLPVTLAANVAQSAGALSLDALRGKIAGSGLSGALSVSFKEGVPQLAGKLAADAVDLSFPVEMVLGQVAAAGGKGRWPSAPFATAAAVPLAADLDLAAGTLSAGMLGEVRGATLKVKLDRAGLRVSDLKGKFRGGALSGLFELRNNAGTALLSAEARLAGADLAEVLQGSGVVGAGDIALAVTGSGKSADAVVASLAGSGTASFRDLVVPGIDMRAFAGLLAGADRIGRDIDAAKTASFAPALVRRGRFTAGEGDLAFTIAGGVLRAPPLRLEDEAATVTVAPRADLNRLVATAEGSIDYKPGEEALVGSQPTVNFTGEGPLDAMRFRLDTGPLAQFLTQRALEREQARVEAMQSALLEKQRLRREVRYFLDLAETRRRIEEERIRAEEERRKAEEEAARAAAEAAEAARRALEEQAPAGEGTPPPLPAAPTDEIRKLLLQTPGAPPQGAASPQGKPDVTGTAVPDAAPPATGGKRRSGFQGLPGVSDVFGKGKLSIESLTGQPAR